MKHHGLDRERADPRPRSLARRLLKSMSVKQGRKYDSPASAAEIPAFIAFHHLDVSEILEPLQSFSERL